MRWIVRRPEDYGFRIIKRFLLFPREINREARFLETAYILQKYNAYPGDYYWADVRWADSDEYEKHKEYMRRREKTI